MNKLLIFVTLALSFGLVTSAAAASEHKAKKAHDRPAWLEKLETQIDYEEMMSGMEGRQDRLDKTFMQLMDRLQDKIQEHATPASTGGGFHDSWSAHQLQQSYLLGPVEATEKVFIFCTPSLLIMATTAEESTPPLSAIHNFLGFNNSRFLEISFKIKFSINSIFGSVLLDLKSFDIFLGKFGIIDGSYLRVRILTIDEGLIFGLEISTSQSSKN